MAVVFFFFTALLASSLDRKMGDDTKKKKSRHPIANFDLIIHQREMFVEREKKKTGKSNHIPLNYMGLSCILMTCHSVETINITSVLYI